MTDGVTSGGANDLSVPLRFCPECPFDGWTEAYYCPDCEAPFFPSARKGSRLRPTLNSEVN